MGMTTRKPALTWQRKQILSVIARRPGINTAELNRAARTARGGHAPMYSLVDRAMRSGLISRCPATSGRGGGLQLTALAAELLG